MSEQELRETLFGAVEALGFALERGRDTSRLAQDTVSSLGAMPPQFVQDAAELINSALASGSAYANPKQSLLGRKLVASGLFNKLPGSPWIEIFSINGRIREAALANIQGPAPTPFFVAGLAYRLNDWVPQVRAAAVACAERVFPLTDAATIAGAAPVLLGRRWLWKRWSDEGAIIDELLHRPDVAEFLFHDLRGGRASSLFRQALRLPSLDKRLPELATSASSPQVRFLASKALIDGKVQWVTGREQKYVDKVYNKRRWVPVLKERQVKRSLSTGDLIELAAVDRSPLVRKAAADGLIQHRAELLNIRQIAKLLRDDKSPAVRERIAFVDRKLAEEITERPHRRKSGSAAKAKSAGKGSRSPG